MAAKAGVYPQVNNTIFNNGNTNTAQILLAMNAKIKLEQGYNNIFSTNTNIKRISQFAKPAYSSKEQLIAANNYWGSSSVNNNYFNPNDGWANFTQFSSTPFSANTNSASELSAEANLLKEGLKLEENQQYSKANDKYTELISSYPQTQESYFAISRQPDLYKSAAFDLSSLTNLLGEKIANDIWQDKDYLKNSWQRHFWSLKNMQWQPIWVMR